MNFALMMFAGSAGVGILIAIAVIVLIALIALISGIKIVPQSKAYVVERFGAYEKTWETGIHILIPLIERVAKQVSLKDALTFMISFSDNTATNLLINIAGMDEINRHIKEIGCKNTVLARKMMDFKAREEGRDNYTSLEDCYTVMEIL